MEPWFMNCLVYDLGENDYTLCLSSNVDFVNESKFCKMFLRTELFANISVCKSRYYCTSHLCTIICIVPDTKRGQLIAPVVRIAILSLTVIILFVEMVQFFVLCHFHALTTSFSYSSFLQAEFEDGRA